MLTSRNIKTSIDFIIEKDVSESIGCQKFKLLHKINYLIFLPRKLQIKITKNKSNVSSNLYILKKATPYNLGFLISSWEHKTLYALNCLNKSI